MPRRLVTRAVLLGIEVLGMRYAEETIILVMPEYSRKQL